MHLALNLMELAAKGMSMKSILEGIKTAAEKAIADPTENNIEDVSISLILLSMKRNYDKDPSFNMTKHVESVMAAQEAVFEANNIVNKDDKKE